MNKDDSTMNMPNATARIRNATDVSVILRDSRRSLLMAREYDNNALHEMTVKCHQCGKEKWIADNRCYAYKVRGRRYSKSGHYKTLYFCSYSCYRKWEVDNE